MKPWPRSSPSCSARATGDGLEGARRATAGLAHVVGRRRAPGLHVGAIALADPDREVEALDQPPGAARVVGVAVGQRVGADGVAVQRLDQALGRALGAGVDDDVAEQVGVDPVARRERDVEDVLGDAADRHRSADDLYRPPMPDEPVLTERRDGVLLITLNRPQARNAVNLALAEGVAAALDELDADGDVAVGVITGAGTGFCAGMDLKAFVTGERPWVGDRGFAGIVQRASRKPLIAAIEGFAVAGGLEVALACDLIVAAREAKLGIPEVKRSLVAAGGALHAPAAPRPLRRRDGAGAHRRHDHGRARLRARPRQPPGRARRGGRRGAGARGAPSPRNGPLALDATKAILQQQFDWSEEEFWQRQGELSGPVFTSRGRARGRGRLLGEARPRVAGALALS